MATLSDAGIRAAIRDVERSGRQRKLSDGRGRGTGRLLLVVRPAAGGASAEWYAQQYRGHDRRVLVKIGPYPALTLATARARFTAEFQPAILARESVKRARSTTPGSVRELFDGYCEYLRAAGKPSVVDVRKALDKAAAFIGEDRQARDVSAGDVVEYLRGIYGRGAASMADHARGYIRAAFSWALRSEMDYRSDMPRRFGLAANPAADIPSEPKVPGERWLRPDEFVAVWRWLDSTQDVAPQYVAALRVLMATGQRVTEIAGLRRDQWDSDGRLLTWSTTKNKRPHVLPVGDIAASIIDSRAGNGTLLFPSVADPDRPPKHGSLYCALWRERDRIGVDGFTVRDLRRTWKTLAGMAGLTKHERDLLQNHARHDVSSRHYDRYEYLDEKRAAVARWDAWMRELLGSSQWCGPSGRRG